MVEGLDKPIKEPKKSKYSIEEIKEKNLKYPIVKYYLYERDLGKFKKLFEGYFGFVCRKYFYGLPQTSETFIEMREESFVEILEFLELGRYDETKGPFVSYLFMVIRWKLSVHMARFNKKRKTETSLSNKPHIKYSGSENVEFNHEDIKNYITSIINEYGMTDVKVEEIMGGLFFNDKPQPTFNLKLIFWMVYKKFMLE